MIKVSSSTYYGKYKIGLLVSIFDFYETLPSPKIAVEIDGNIVEDSKQRGRPLYFNTPVEALEYVKHWIDYLSNS